MAVPSMTVDLYTVDEVAERLHVHPQTVRVWIRRGELGHVRVGRKVRVADDQLATFIDAHRTDAD